MTAVTMEGCLDLNTAPAVQRNLMGRLAAEQPLRLDMSRVTWIDSAGLASLVHLLAEARRQGGDIIVEQASDAVRRMLRLAKLDCLFPEQATRAGD